MAIAIGDKDEAHCLDAIKSGGDLTFTIEDGKGTLVDIRLPNDRNFNQLYDQVCIRLRDLETGLQFSDEAICIAQALSHDHFFECSML